MAGAAPFHDHRDGTLIDIWVQPRASRSEIIGIHDDALRIRVAAPPVDGAANEAIVELLSKRLRIPRVEIQIVYGASGRRKRVLVRGVDSETARDSLT